MEVKRQLDVLDRQLAKNQYIAGDNYTIADMAIWPWYGALVNNKVYEATEFLQTHTYRNVASDFDTRTQDKLSSGEST